MLLRRNGGGLEAKTGRIGPETFFIKYQIHRYTKPQIHKYKYRNGGAHKAKEELAQRKVYTQVVDWLFWYFGDAKKHLLKMNPKYNYVLPSFSSLKSNTVVPPPPLSLFWNIAPGISFDTFLKLALIEMSGCGCKYRIYGGNQASTAAERSDGCYKYNIEQYSNIQI